MKVKYADEGVEEKEVYGVVRVELMGRVGNFDVLAEDEGAQPLIGQIVFERLDLIIEPSTKRLIPNPRSPENADDRGIRSRIRRRLPATLLNPLKTLCKQSSN